jgi:alpha-L-fucosidase
VLADLSAACKEYGLKFGIYISPWDRNHPAYGTPGYNDVYVNTMKEAVTAYGPIFEMWWDGANGEGPNGKKQVYDFARFERVIKEIAPQAVVFSDIGPDIRWVGNERGIAGQTNWNLLDTAGFKRGEGGPPLDTLNQGNVNGKQWIPAECDVSIRPGWFYHAKEDDKVKTAEELMRLYLESVGRGANFLLNVPPDRRGLIHPNDSAELVRFHRLRESFYQKDITKEFELAASNSRKKYPASFLTDGNRTTCWASQDGEHSPQLNFRSAVPHSFNTLVLEEYLEAGQRIRAFTVEVWEGDHYREVARGTTVGRKRILQFPRQTSTGLRITFNDAKAAPAMAEIRVLDAPYY